MVEEPITPEDDARREADTEACVKAICEDAEIALHATGARSESIAERTAFLTGFVCGVESSSRSGYSQETMADAAHKVIRDLDAAMSGALRKVNKPIIRVVR